MDSDFHLLRYNPADGSLTEGGGKPFWNIHFDLPATYDYLTAMAIDPSGYIYLAGNTRNGLLSDQTYDGTSNVLALIYDYEGTFLGATNYDKAGKEENVTAIAVNRLGESFIAGTSVNVAENADYLVLKQSNGYPLVPTPFTATAQMDSSKVDLNWQHSNANATFVIDRTTGPATPLSDWTEIATLGAGSTSFIDSSLSADSNYCYRITALIDTFPSRKLVRCVTTRVSPPVLAPPVLAPDPLAPQITLTWNQVEHNAGYKIERKIGFGAWSELIPKGVGVNSHTDIELSPGTTYFYRVSTVSATGTSLPGNEQSIITMPAAPALNAPSWVSNCQMQLDWTWPTGTADFTLYMKLSGGSYEPVPNCTRLVSTYSR
jgi:large repetitive protein